MTPTQTADRIIELADGLGYGIDIDFTGRKPIKIKTNTGSTKSFPTMDHALSFLEARRTELLRFGSL